MFWEEIMFLFCVSYFYNQVVNPACNKVAHLFIAVVSQMFVCMYTDEYIYTCVCVCVWGCVCVCACRCRHTHTHEHSIEYCMCSCVKHAIYNPTKYLFGLCLFCEYSFKFAHHGCDCEITCSWDVVCIPTYALHLLCGLVTKISCTALLSTVTFYELKMFSKCRYKYLLTQWLP